MSDGYKKFLREKRIYNIFVFMTQISLVVLFLLIWQVLADKKIIDTFLLSSPKRIINTIIYLYNSHNLFNNIFTTLFEILISFILGNIIGLFVASILWFNKFLAKVFDPFLTILNSLPKVAFGPLIIVWAGANIKSIIIMSLLISSIISIINIYNAFKNTNKDYIKVIRSMKASKLQIFKYVVFPSNIIQIIDNCKINISMCFVGVIMGELLVSKEGIGYLIIYGSQTFNMNLVITGVILLIILTILLYLLFSLVEKYIENKM